MKLLSLFIACVAVLAKDPPPVVPSYDIASYTGFWYQLADHPQVYEVLCKYCTSANYTANPDGTIHVENGCSTSVGKKPQFIEAEARIPDKLVPAKLEVKFFGLFSGPYWIVDLGPKMNDGRYEWAIVSDGSRVSLYILSRTPTPNDLTLATIYKSLRDKDFDLAKIRNTTQDGCARAF